MQSRHVFLNLCSALALAVASAMAVAQTTAPDTMGAMHQHEHMDKMKKEMPSMHTMPATVSSVDMKTGEVMVTSEGMSLRVHFPAASVADLKAGDKITLHMGFSKP